MIRARETTSPTPATAIAARPPGARLATAIPPSDTPSTVKKNINATGTAPPTPTPTTTPAVPTAPSAPPATASPRPAEDDEST